MAKSFTRRVFHLVLLAAFALALAPAFSLGLESYRAAANDYSRAMHARANTVAQAQANEPLLTSIVMLRTQP